MLEKNSPKPLYQQLKDILVDAIDSEKWKANEKIPSENELSSIYGLSRMTVRSVLTERRPSLQSAGKGNVCCREDCDSQSILYRYS